MTIAEQMKAAIPVLLAAADSDDFDKLTDAAAAVAELLLSMREMDRDAWADTETSAAFAELEPLLKRVRPRLERLRERVAFGKA
jgi:hypothetical protein